MNVEKWGDLKILSGRPIGLFDSGLGGLTVLKELKRALPNESFIYLGDTARAPYGSKGSATILRYSHECTDFLCRAEIKLLVVACNSASSIALSSLEQEFPYPIVGTIEPAVQFALEQSRAGRIGVIGTNATIASGVYQRRLRELDDSLHVISKACPLFVPLVEEGILSGKLVDNVIEHYLSDLKTEEIDALILGCTHYPLLKDALAKFFGQAVQIIECSCAIAEEVKELLASWKLSVPADCAANKISDQYFVTDDVGRFNFLATQFLEGCSVQAAKVESLES